jgi:hypothetical protein
MLQCKFKLILKKGYNINYSLKSRLDEKAITSNRESPCHGELYLRWVLTTRQALKEVCAISLIILLFILIYRLKSFRFNFRMHDFNWG